MRGVMGLTNFIDCTIKFLESSQSHRHQGLMSSFMRNLARPIQEIVVIYAPFLIYSISLGPILLRIANPQSPILLTSFVSLNSFPLYIFLPTYCLLVILDSFFYFFPTTCVWYSISFMLFFMIRVQEKIQHMIDSLKTR